MIIVRISGGLGNQLFQYAFGRALSLRKHTSLAVDISSFTYTNSRRTDRKLLLDNFNISGKLATNKSFEALGIPSPVNQSMWSKLIRRLHRFRESFQPLSKRTYIIEPRFTFSPEVLDVSGGAYFVGIWQSEKYFLDQKETIRKDLELKSLFSLNAEAQLAKINNSNSVSLHIRRGDYAVHSLLDKKHGPLSSEYYDKSISYITKLIPNAQFFIFSDDMEWVKNNLTIDYPKFYISNNNITDCEELILMSKCKHNIIANSSFSWWGAWLNTNKDKIVIAPKKWFNVENIKTDDLLPHSWIQL